MSRLNINQPMRQLRSGPFRSDLVVRPTPEADFYADRFSTACRMYLEAPPGVVGLLTLRSADSPLLVSGIDATRDKLLFLPGGSGVGMVLPDLGGSEVITIPQERFGQMMAALCPEISPFDRTSLFEGNERRLQALVQSILNVLNDPESHQDEERVSNLLAAVFAWLSAGIPCPLPSSMEFPAYRRIAREAEEYICEHYRQPIHIEDICRSTGSGLRTLQRCVRRFFDVTVTELIESVRMEAANRELLASDPAEITVTQVAMNNGFRHLGRFSVAFRRRFGERPSEVLARQSVRKWLCHPSVLVKDLAE